MQALERVRPVAQELLLVPGHGEQRSPWLWERAERVLELTQRLAKLPEIAGRPLDPVALGAAALFHCTGWVVQVRQGRLAAAQVLARPTSDIQRELAAALLHEHAGPLLPPRSVRLAADALRQCGRRDTTLLEAQLLTEAENLEDVGVLHVLRQVRQYHVDGRPLRQLLQAWFRQQEYHYWDVRINEGFRFETTRGLARARLGAVAQLMTALDHELEGADVRAALAAADTPAPAADV